jgi:tRNA (cmo5U34)-methyltransferase
LALYTDADRADVREGPLYEASFETTVDHSEVLEVLPDRQSALTGRLITALREIIRWANLGGLGRVSSRRNLVLTHETRETRMKSTVEQIRARFDNDVERFSNLETGQSATIDAPPVLELISQAATATNPGARDLLDIGCGAGNYSLKLLQTLPDLNVTLIDLSRPMLERAEQRLRPATKGHIEVVQGDVRDLDLGEARFDVIVAAAVLHHLRTDAEWVAVFAKFFKALRPGGSIWISDLIEHSTAAIQELMWRRYGEYLVGLKDEAYRDTVFAYVTQEDTPRPLMYQIELLRKVGFRQVEILHKTNVFAAFGARTS